MAKQLKEVTRAFDEFIKVMAETEEFKELIDIIAMRGENNDKQNETS